MMLYVYGVVDTSDFEVIRGEGQEGGDILAVPAERLAGAVSHLSAGVIEATVQSVWRHEKVLWRLMRDHAVLPLRFGTICRDADTLRDCLLRSINIFVGDLGRVRGKVEIALRVIETERQKEQRNVPLPPGTGHGTAYLRARRQHHLGVMEREDRARQIGQLLSGYVDVSAENLVCTMPADGTPGISVSCLIDRGRIGTLDAALEEFQSDHPQLLVMRTGPWAPYSFVTPSALAGGR